jgi:hypothetical protein
VQSFEKLLSLRPGKTNLGNRSDSKNSNYCRFSTGPGNCCGRWIRQLRNNDGLTYPYKEFPGLSALDQYKEW